MTDDWGGGKGLGGQLLQMPLCRTANMDRILHEEHTVRCERYLNRTPERPRPWTEVRLRWVPLPT